MHTYFFKHELLRMIKLKKNYLFVISIFLMMLVYIFFIMPNHQSIYTFDAKKAEQNVEDISYILKGMEEREGTGVGGMTGPAYSMTLGRYDVERSMVYAYKDQSYNRFLRLYLLNLHHILPEKLQLLTKDSPYPGKDENHKFTQTLMMYESYLKEDIPISRALIEQKTASQSLYHFLLSAGVFLVLFLVLYVSSDVLVKDRQNKTILQGVPISWYRLINLKSVVAIVYSLFVVLILTGIAFVAIGIQNGFGSFAFKIPTIFGEYDYTGANYDMMTLWKFILLSAAFLLLLLVLFTRLNMIFSLIFKNTWVVLMISSLVLFAEQIYLTRTSRELFGIDIAFFPQTYFDFGNVITGERMFLLNTDSITYAKGFLVIGLTIVVVEIILWMMSKIIGKRRFYKV